MTYVIICHWSRRENLSPMQGRGGPSVTETRLERVE